MSRLLVTFKLLTATILILISEVNAQINLNVKSENVHHNNTPKILSPTKVVNTNHALGISSSNNHTKLNENDDKLTNQAAVHANIGVNNHIKEVSSAFSRAVNKEILANAAHHNVSDPKGPILVSSQQVQSQLPSRSTLFPTAQVTLNSSGSIKPPLKTTASSQFFHSKPHRAIAIAISGGSKNHQSVSVNNQHISVSNSGSQSSNSYNVLKTNNAGLFADNASLRNIANHSNVEQSSSVPHYRLTTSNKEMITANNFNITKSTTVREGNENRLNASSAAQEVSYGTTSCVLVNNNKTHTLAKFEAWGQPICRKLLMVDNDKSSLTDKQLSRINLQIKQFDLHTDGKFCKCLNISDRSQTEQHGLDRLQLSKLCRSYMNRDSDFKSWEECNIKIWLPVLDLEIDRIVKNRHNCANKNRSEEKNHDNTVVNKSGIKLSSYQRHNSRAFNTASISHEMASRMNQSNTNNGLIDILKENSNEQHEQINGTGITSHYKLNSNALHSTRPKNASYQTVGNVQHDQENRNRTYETTLNKSQQIVSNKSAFIKDSNKTSTSRPSDSAGHHILVKKIPAITGEEKHENKTSATHQPRKIATPVNISRNLAERKLKVDQALGNLSLLIHKTKITNLTDSHNTTTINTDILRKNHHRVISTMVPELNNINATESKSFPLHNNKSTVTIDKDQQSIPIYSNHSTEVKTVASHIKDVPRKNVTIIKNMIGNKGVGNTNNRARLHPFNNETFGHLGDIMRVKLEKDKNENIKLMPLNGSKVFRVNGGKLQENENSTHWTVTLKISGKYDHKANASNLLTLNNSMLRAKNVTERVFPSLSANNRLIQESERNKQVVKTSTSKVESKQSVHDQFLELKKKFGSDNVHEVIVIGHHTDGDDLINDHDAVKKHPRIKSDGGIKHNKKDSGNDLRVTSKPAEFSIQDNGKNVDKGVSNKISDMIRREGGLSEITASITTEISDSDKRDGSKHFDEHYEHRDLLIGLNDGDVVHIDSGKTSAENSRWKL